jgi:hypothetical protein
MAHKRFVGLRDCAAVASVAAGGKHARIAHRQDRKIKRARSNAFLLSRIDHELVDLGIGQRGMMLDPANL